MEVGQKVRVCRIRDRVIKTIGNKLGQVGTVQGFRATDGSGIGVIVAFEDKTATWFFADEVEPIQ